MSRDNFAKSVRRNLAIRAACTCSNPECGRTTDGPTTDPGGSINIGVAAHITAASPGGPRYDSSLTPEERRSLQNGIWLCQNCGKLVDSDPQTYPVELLRRWKADHEARKECEVRTGERGSAAPVVTPDAMAVAKALAAASGGAEGTIWFHASGRTVAWELRGAIQTTVSRRGLARFVEALECLEETGLGTVVWRNRDHPQKFTLSSDGWKRAENLARSPHEPWWTSD